MGHMHSFTGNGSINIDRKIMCPETSFVVIKIFNPESAFLINTYMFLHQGLQKDLLQLLIHFPGMGTTVGNHITTPDPHIQIIKFFFEVIHGGLHPLLEVIIFFRPAIMFFKDLPQLVSEFESRTFQSGNKIQ